MLVLVLSIESCVCTVTVRSVIWRCAVCSVVTYIHTWLPWSATRESAGTDGHQRDGSMHRLQLIISTVAHREDGVLMY